MTSELLSPDVVLLLCTHHMWQFVTRNGFTVSRMSERVPLMLRNRVVLVASWYDHGWELPCKRLTAEFHRRCEKHFAELGIPQRNLHYRRYRANMVWQQMMNLETHPAQPEIRVVVKLRDDYDLLEPIYKSVDGKEQQDLYSLLCKEEETRRSACIIG